VVCCGCSLCFVSFSCVLSWAELALTSGTDIRPPHRDGPFSTEVTRTLLFERHDRLLHRARRIERPGHPRRQHETNAFWKSFNESRSRACREPWFAKPPAGACGQATLFNFSLDVCLRQSLPARSYITARSPSNDVRRRGGAGPSHPSLAAIL
jgi:hypothetical protein